MAYTNKTTNYELPQYVSTDKPTYLVDFNEAMRDIDSAMHTNATNIETNATNITVTSNKIGDLTTLETTTKTDTVSAINEVNNNIGDLSSLETTIKSSVTGAINEIVEKFDLSDITTYRETSMAGVTISDGVINGMAITVATNSDKSICKIYGDINTGNNTDGATIEVTFPTSFVVEDTFNVYPAGVRVGAWNETTPSVNTITYIRFNQDGTITLGCKGVGERNHFMFIPFIIFVKDFGDTPTNNL